MDMNKTSGMAFREAWFAMLNGKKVKLPSWAGYWAFENGTIMMHCKDGSILDIRESQNVGYTMSNIAADDWMIVDAR